jgi:hypothetical protein
MIVPQWDPEKRDWRTAHAKIVTRRRGSRLIVRWIPLRAAPTSDPEVAPHDRIKRGGLVQFLRRLRRNR